MSWPMSGGTKVSVSIPASQAARLARAINFWLSRIQDFQEGEVENETFREISDLNLEEGDLGVLAAMISGMTISDDVSLSIVPDKRTPGSSGYGYFSGPFEGQYIPPPESES